MSAGTLLERLQGVRKTGQGRWLAKCPAHEDGRPSLSIRETDDGRGLVYCFAGCSTAEVLDATGLSWPALFPPAAPGSGARPALKPHVRDLIEVLGFELTVDVITIGDIIAKRDVSEADRQRAIIAKQRILAFIQELNNAT